MISNTDNDNKILQPCPHCGSDDLVENTWSVTEGEVAAIECNQCLSGAVRSVWNNRAFVNDSELVALERFLAHEMTRSDIEWYCPIELKGPPHAGRWYDTDHPSPGDDDCVARAVRYLDWRGLIRHHPESHNLVQVNGPFDRSDNDA